MKNHNQQILLNILNARPQSYAEFLHLKRKFSNKLNLAPISNATLIKAWRQLKKGANKFAPTRSAIFDDRVATNLFAAYLTKRPTRTLSGVTPITVLTKPYSCPGKCIYCPKESGMPKSYLSNEPAAQRAKMNNFDPARQVKMRIRALEANGHEVDKIELLILGGCFNAYPRAYQKFFIKKCFDTCNDYYCEHQGCSLLHSGGRRPCLLLAKNLTATFKQNETARYKIIGVTVETRPDLINEQEIKWFRELGITRVQLGVQHLDDKILKLNRRGHTTEQTIKATKLLKQAGFKIDYHLMPDLPGSTPKKDLKMFKQLFTDENFQPDQIKIYPTIVNKYAPLYKWYKLGKYKPYKSYQLITLLTKIKQIIPYYVRINRLIRDIPQESIVAGNKITNLRQILADKMKQRNLKCRCMRCREAKENVSDIKKAKLFTQKYRASGGWEYFISYESPKRDKLYSFLRLRINDNSGSGRPCLSPLLPECRRHYLPELQNAALVRELHTYGQLVPVDKGSGSRWPGRRPAINAAQHTGFGKRLMKIAEDLTKKHGLKKIAVISGIGVRHYYRKLGYKLQGTYIVKNITENTR